jgi:nucleotide-binding universal stress UspA family protein
MNDPRNILVALDFSPWSDAALEEAMRLCSKFRATVHLLHVFTLQDKPEWASLEEERAVERTRLDQDAATCRASGHAAEVLWREGDPGPQVILAATHTHADLIILGSSGRSGVKRLLLGSVAEKVVRNASCNVLVVRRTA